MKTEQLVLVSNLFLALLILPGMCDPWIIRNQQQSLVCSLKTYMAWAYTLPREWQIALLNIHTEDDHNKTA